MTEQLCKVDDYKEIDYKPYRLGYVIIRDNRGEKSDPLPIFLNSDFYWDEISSQVETYKQALESGYIIGDDSARFFL